MRYLVKRIIFLGPAMVVYAIIGFSLGEIFLPVLGIIILVFAMGIVAISIRNVIKYDKKFFESGPGDKVRLHIFFRKSIYLVSLVALLILSIVLSGVTDHLPIIERILESAIFVLLIIILAGVRTLIDEYVSTNHNYYFFKACMTLAKPLSSDKQYLHFLVGLRYYDKYLRRRFGLAIKNLESIFGQFIVKQTSDRNRIIQEFVSVDGDTFVPIRIISNSLRNNPEDILTKSPYVEKVKDVVTIIIPIFTVVISIMQWLVK